MDIFKIYKQQFEVQKEIEDYVMKREEFANKYGLTFNYDDFLKQIKKTRLTTELDLKQAFEQEKTKFEWRTIRRSSI